MNLSTRYLGLDLKNPVVVSASPLSRNLDSIKRLEDAGAAAIVMHSLFEEEIRIEQQAHDQIIYQSNDLSSEAGHFFASDLPVQAFSDHYLRLLQQACEETDIPIIASLNGQTREGWVEYANLIQDAGADAIELNTYQIADDFTLSGEEVESRLISMIQSIRQAVSIPLSVKVSPFYSSIGYTLNQLVKAGANGVVLFNRFYQPDFNITKRAVEPQLELSTAHEIRLPLMWIGMLYGNISASIAASRGVESYEQIVKYLLAGADCVMTTSALLRFGPSYLDVLLKGLCQWMETEGYNCVADMQGAMSQKNIADPSLYVRNGYIKTLDLTTLADAHI